MRGLRAGFIPSFSYMFKCEIASEREMISFGFKVTWDLHQRQLLKFV